MRLINSLPHLVGVLAERDSGQVATRQMIALGCGLAARAFLQPSQLLEATVELIHLPTHLHGLNHQFAGQIEVVALVWTV